MNKILAAIMLPLLGLVSAAAQESGGDQIVVSIGDKAKITKTEFERAVTGAVQARMAQARRLGITDPQRLAQMPSHEERLKILDAMINTKILYILAEDARVEVTDEEVNAEIDKHRAALPPNMTFDQFMERQGITLDEISELTRMRLISKKFSDDKVKDVAITPEEIEAEYESLKANHRMDTADIAHVLVRVTANDPAAWEEGKKEIDAAYARIEAGDDFTEVVKEFSDDELTRENGGIFDDAMRGNLGPEFDQRMFDIPLNEVTQPFKTRAGWHIMKVTERGVAPLEGPIREQLGNALLQQRKAQTIEKLIADARSTMSVSITLPPESPSAGGSAPVSAPSLLDNAT